MKINTTAIRRIFTCRNLFRKMAFAFIAMVTTLSTGLVRLQAQAALPYTVTDLGTVTSLGGLNNQPGNQLAIVFNRGDQVVVRIFQSNCRPDAEFTLPGDGRGVSINDGRVLVASSGFELFGSPCIFLDEDLSFLTSLPFLQGTLSVDVKANNNSRFAVGVSDVIELGEFHQSVPTRWRFTPGPGGGFSVERLQTAFRPAPLNNFRLPGTALDINDSGRVVGTQNGVACIFRDNLDPQLFGSNVKEARGISNNDFITGIGAFATAAGTQLRGFILHPNGAFFLMRIPYVPTPFPYPPYNNLFYGCQTNKINSAGHAVGTVLSYNGKAATIWDRFGGMRDLTAACGLTTGKLTEAVDINDQGDILSYGLVNGVVHGFLLRPTGAPLTFASSGLY